ncbi:MAG TPA: crotonase/enoyl-CoA hydratase family protein [Corynebacterium xerosis]|uniref:crotonase/enoyl-CoA hydratase family protein n=1 Tax=Corynebacterium xerosis TaxID=1725 RepID=UPI001DCD7C35|nr:crotonase/enoyl-CoA hydratase family protein [Corynebacterium xerosis]HJG56985.1 crotonase/enoyl-CoA hydratase family protein [Corynebacterium xerosis]
MNSRDTDVATHENATSTTGPSATAADAPVTISYEEIDGARIAVVSLNRPAKLNGLTMAMLRGLDEAAKSLRRDRDLRGVIFAGAGDSFCAGLDFGSVLKNPMDIVKAFAPNPLAGDGANLFQRVCWEWRRLPAPVIAVVHGHCYGGGVQLALGADFRVTAADARWSILEAKWGLIPDMSGARTLADHVGAEQARWLTMTGRELSGAEAVEVGLATETTESLDDAHSRAREILRELMGRSPDQLAATKSLFNHAWRSPRATFRAERFEQAKLLLSENAARARTAAMKKAPPNFVRRGTWAFGAKKK